MSEGRDFKRGQIGYLQIPASDVQRAARFYQAVFGWEIEHPYASFTSPGLIGNFFSDRAPTHDAGPLLWIFVPEIVHALEIVNANGGRVLQAPEADMHGPRVLATVADSEGNAIGVYAVTPKTEAG